MFADAGFEALRLASRDMFPAPQTKRTAFVVGGRQPRRTTCCRGYLTMHALPPLLIVVGLASLFYEELLVSVMPPLMPSAPRRTAAPSSGSSVDGLSGYWTKMDVRDAATLSEDEFEREYMKKGQGLTLVLFLSLT